MKKSKTTDGMFSEGMVGFLGIIDDIRPRNGFPVACYADYAYDPYKRRSIPIEIIRECEYNSDEVLAYREFPNEDDGTTRIVFPVEKFFLDGILLTDNFVEGSSPDGDSGVHLIWQFLQWKNHAATGRFRIGSRIYVGKRDNLYPEESASEKKSRTTFSGMVGELQPFEKVELFVDAGDETYDPETSHFREVVRYYDSEKMVALLWPARPLVENFDRLDLRMPEGVEPKVDFENEDGFEILNDNFVSMFIPTGDDPEPHIWEFLAWTRYEGYGRFLVDDVDCVGTPSVLIETDQWDGVNNWEESEEDTCGCSCGVCEEAGPYDIEYAVGFKNVGEGYDEVGVDKSDPENGWVVKEGTLRVESRPIDEKRATDSKYLLGGILRNGENPPFGTVWNPMTQQLEPDTSFDDSALEDGSLVGEVHAYDQGIRQMAEDAPNRELRKAVIRNKILEELLVESLDHICPRMMECHRCKVIRGKLRIIDATVEIAYEDLLIVEGQE